MGTSACRCSVHPRARGEQRAPVSVVKLVAGSSPRTRGTATRRNPHRPPGRFIPAHAGNRSRTNTRWPTVAVHPRARGEQVIGGDGHAAGSGSSPRTRGTVDLARPRLRLRRFIPAHAGNRRPASGTCATWPVHPRARGEQRRSATHGWGAGGSSPRTRGTDRDRLADGQQARFIPAHAGNSATSAPRRRAGSVHPRARGEQRRRRRDLWCEAGSSPRTRGTVLKLGRAQFISRFIPAHAGNRPRRPPPTAAPAVHPRARGEQTIRSIAKTESAGSSPRTRGTDFFPPPPPEKERFIPAHAGNR